MNDFQSKRKLKENIFLIGFMGAGKSTVAGMLHRLTNAPVIEMDQEIERENGMSIPEIFCEKGEDYFRGQETELLVKLQSGGFCIVSCGGGVPMREENVLQMRKSGKIILLLASPETVLARVRENDDRPLLQGKKNVKDIGDLMEQRRGRYEAAADVMISTDGKSPRQIAEEILSCMNR